MIKMLKVEWIKEKRAANSTLKYIVPVIFVLFNLFMVSIMGQSPVGRSYLMATAFNWHPVLILPIILSLLVVNIDGKEKEEYDDLVQEAIKNGRAISSEIIGSNIFKAYTRGNRQLVIRYRVNVIFTNEKLYRLFENFECGYIVLIIIIWFLGFALFLIRSSNILKREIHKIAMANDNISRMDLDYEREYSKYKEIDGVLVSIDVLAENLKKSLDEQWDMQVKQKELVEQLTHDIRTPITLIKGNLELLKEENPGLSSDRFADISNGIDRLEKYIDKLKKFSYTMEGKKRCCK